MQASIAKPKKVVIPFSREWKQVKKLGILERVMLMNSKHQDQTAIIEANDRWFKELFKTK